MTRVVVIAGAIYQAGYQEGLVTYAKDPKEMESQMVTTILTADSRLKKEDLKIYTRRDQMYRRTERVTKRVIEAARLYCHNQLNAAEQKLSENRALREKLVKLRSSPAEFQSLDEGKREELVEDLKRIANEESSLLEEVKQHTAVCHKIDHEWALVVSNRDDFNAFVTPLLPSKIFIHQGLLEMVANDDELALIIGHELSHVILGHTEDTIPFNTLLLLGQLIVMTLVDPIGITSFIFDILVERLREFLTASYSRQHEEEADNLGIQIASLACFNVEKGSKVFQKFYVKDHRTVTHWNDTHPSSLERYNKLLLQSPELEKMRGDSTVCRKYREDFALAGFRNFIGF